LKLEIRNSVAASRFSSFDFRFSVFPQPSPPGGRGWPAAGAFTSRSGPGEGAFSAQQAAEPCIAPTTERATRADYEHLAKEIEQLTGLPLALENVYRYVVFLPSKQSAEIPVPNRFFCVSEEGELKVRGLECRRHDTPPFISRMQREVLAILAEARDYATYCAKLREAQQVYERYAARLRDGSVAPEELVIRKRLTKAPASYQKNSVTAIAARQLDRAGVKLRPGENIEFIITDADSSLVDDRVRAWTLWEGWRGYDVEAYRQALEKAFEPAAHFAKPIFRQA